MAILTSCTTSYENKGCYLQSFDLSNIKVGVDNCSTIHEKYGPPSTTAIFKTNGQRWYYVHRLLSETPIIGKKPIIHKSIVITFDAKGVVNKIEEIYGEHNIKASKLKTAEDGYKTSFLKETFSNIGKFGSINMSK